MRTSRVPPPARVFGRKQDGLAEGVAIRIGGPHLEIVVPGVARERRVDVEIAEQGSSQGRLVRAGLALCRGAHPREREILERDLLAFAADARGEAGGQTEDPEGAMNSRHRSDSIPRATRGASFRAFAGGTLACLCRSPESGSSRSRAIVAVPAAGALLADLGAEVIKVEVPWGEIYRHARPKLAGFQNDFPAGPPFQMDNRGKRSLAIDLALPQAREALMKVIGRADILITNVLPERLAKYKLDPERLRAERPELIVGRISGYGAEGPRADDPAFDYTAFWALSGLMDSMRDPTAPPAWMRPGVGDHSASLALVDRPARRASHAGCRRWRPAGRGHAPADRLLHQRQRYEPMRSRPASCPRATIALRRAIRSGTTIPVASGPLALPRDDRFGSLLARTLPGARSGSAGERSPLRRRDAAIPQFERARQRCSTGSSARARSRPSARRSPANA